MFEMKKVRIYSVLFLLIILLLPALIFAGGDDPIYDAPGFDAFRETFGASDFEHIDPFTGGLVLYFEDMRLPGNGGLDLVVQRTFNSKNACRNWQETTWNGQTVVPCNNALGGDSWVGNGWTMHFGKLLINGTTYLIEMPDGSIHEAYLNLSQSAWITKDYWTLQWVSGTTYVLTLTDGKKITFNYYGSKTSDGKYDESYASRIEDANGNFIAINYNLVKDAYGFWDYRYIGAIESVTDSTVRVTNFYLTSALIEGKYRLDKIRRPDGEIIQFSYISAAKFPLENNPVLLTTVTPPEGSPWQYDYNYDDHYDTNDYHMVNDLIKVTTPYGGIIDYTYDTESFFYASGTYYASRAVKTKKTSGRDITPGTWNFSYYQDPNNEYTIITDSCGRTVTYGFTGYKSVYAQNGSMWKLGLPISKEIVGEEKVEYEWTPSSSISDDDYDVHLVGTDSWIFVPYLIKQKITRDGHTYTTTYGTTYSDYDNYGNPKRISETGEKTRITNLIYWTNPAKNIVEGKPATEKVSFNGTSDIFTTNYTYDNSTGNEGNLLEIDKYGVKTTYTYYTNGNIQTKKDANLKTTSYVWDKGRISNITYPADPSYSISRIINPIGTIASETNGEGFKTSYNYDGNLRLISVDPPAGNTTTFVYPTDNSYKKESRGGFETFYYYDGFGRPSGSLNSIGVDTGVAYMACGLKDYETSNVGDTTNFDNLGRVESVVHKDGEDISYVYTGNNVTVTDEAGENTVLTYAAFGNPDEKRLMKVQPPSPFNYYTTTYDYNILGSLTEINQTGITRTFDYDSNNFLDFESHPEKGTITYGRDNVGNMTARMDALGPTSYYYDGINRLKTISNGDGTINFTYDKADNRKTMVSPSASIGFTYDPANRMTDKTETISGINYSTTYGYNDNDYITGIDYPSGLHVTYTYNTKNQITAVTDFGESISNIQYYTAGSYLGLPSSLTYSNGLTTTLTYNSRNLTTQIKAGASTMDMRYAYTDPRGNLTSITNYLNASENQTFVYDELNRLKTFNSPGLWGTGSYTYKPDASGNRYTKNVASAATTYYTYSSNRLTSASGAEPFSAAYNTNGDATTMNGFTLTYDDLHNLTSYKQGTTSIAAFTYDGDNMRVTKTSPTDTTVYHYDQEGHVLCENDGNGVLLADYVYLNGKLAAKVVAEPEILEQTRPTSAYKVILVPARTFCLLRHAQSVLFFHLYPAEQKVRN